MASRRRPTDAERALYAALRSTARWLQANATRSLSTAEGRRRVDSALDVVHYGSESLSRLRRLSDGEGPHPIGFDVGGDLVDAVTEWDEPDHGQDVEHEHAADPPRAKRRGRR